MKSSSICVKEFKDNNKVSSHILPIYASSSFTFENVENSLGIFAGKSDGYIYSRYANPTIDAVSNKIALLESHGLDIDSFCYLTSSGMSAISTLVMGILKSGDTILTQGNLYGGTTELFLDIFKNMGINVLFTNLSSTEKVKEALDNNNSIKLIYAETPSNPSLDCIDLLEISNIAKEYNILTAVDNTFCTPLIQQPFSFGIDFIIHSTTKYLNGHGNSTSGAILGRDKNLSKQIWKALKLIGSTCNPFDAWLLNNGLKTVSLRMNEHSKNALTLALFLKNNKRVTKVNYPGISSHKDHLIAKKQMSTFGGMLSFEFDGSYEETLQTINKLKFCTIAPTLGDVDTLLLHPASSSHINVPKEIREANGISDSLIRVSVGIEDINDILSDFNIALS